MTDYLKLQADIEYEFPLDRYYLAGETGHTWLLPIGENKYLLGFNSLGAKQAGEIANVKTRKVGKIIKQSKAVGTVESGKWIGPLKTPFTGTMSRINDLLNDKPGIINDDPYNDGWVAELEIDQETLDSEKDNELIIHIGDKETLETFIKKELTRFELI